MNPQALNPITPPPNYLLYVTDDWEDHLPIILHVKSETEWGMYCEELDGTIFGYVTQYLSGHTNLAQAQKELRNHELENF